MARLPVEQAKAGAKTQPPPSPHCGGLGGQGILSQVKLATAYLFLFFMS